MPVSFLLDPDTTSTLVQPEAFTQKKLPHIAKEIRIWASVKNIIYKWKYIFILTNKMGKKSQEAILTVDQVDHRAI